MSNRPLIATMTNHATSTASATGGNTKQPAQQLVGLPKASPELPAAKAQFDKWAVEQERSPVLDGIKKEDTIEVPGSVTTLLVSW